jgi:hypothetical protein
MALRDTGSRSGSSSETRDLPDYSIVDTKQIEEAVDVYVNAPLVNVDEIKCEVDDLRVQLGVLAEVGQFVQLNIGAAARLGAVELDIQTVQAQALLEARLNNVTGIIARVLTTLDRNPQLLRSVGDVLGDAGAGARDLLTETGGAAGDIGQGAADAVGNLAPGGGGGASAPGTG